ncbi:MAG: prepilin-type N-terminal cleavage/methylation domain-containing protein [Rhodothermales bacterium]
MIDDAGFTLVELLVAMTLAIVVTTLASSTYLFLARTVSVWQEGVHLENTLHATLTRLTEDLYETTDIDRLPDSTYALVRAAGDTIRYALRNRALYRNGRILTDSTLMAGVVFSVTAKPDAPAAFEFRLTLSSRRRALASTVRIVQRHPDPWRSLRP